MSNTRSSRFAELTVPLLVVVAFCGRCGLRGRLRRRLRFSGTLGGRRALRGTTGDPGDGRPGSTRRPRPPHCRRRRGSRDQSARARERDRRDRRRVARTGRRPRGAGRRTDPLRLPRCPAQPAPRPGRAPGRPRPVRRAHDGTGRRRDRLLATRRPAALGARPGRGALRRGPDLSARPRCRPPRPRPPGVGRTGPARPIRSGRSGPRSCGPASVSTRCARPSLRYGPVGDTPSVPRLRWQLWALRPGLDGASRPSTTITRRGGLSDSRSEHAACRGALPVQGEPPGGRFPAVGAACSRFVRDSGYDHSEHGG